MNVHATCCRQIHFHHPMQCSRSMTSGLWRAAARGGPSRLSAQSATAAVPRRVMPATCMPSSPCFFSTSRLAEQSEQAKKADEKKEVENEVGGETMGATDQDKQVGGSEVEELQKTLQEKEARIKELSDAVLYGKADFQNMQRRAKEEKAQAGDYAITKFARDLTSSLDILALALRSVPESLRTRPADATEAEDPRKAVAELYSGVELTSKSIVDMLRMHGVTTFDPTGEKFNPLEHEAMYQAPVPDKEPGTVLECSKAGYKIKDRILRAAQVGIVQDSS